MNKDRIAQVVFTVLFLGTVIFGTIYIMSHEDTTRNDAPYQKQWGFE